MRDVDDGQTLRARIPKGFRLFLGTVPAPPVPMKPEPPSSAVVELDRQEQAF